MKWILAVVIAIFIAGWLWVIYTTDWQEELDDMERELQKEHDLAEKE